MRTKALGPLISHSWRAPARPAFCVTRGSADSKESGRRHCWFCPELIIYAKVTSALTPLQERVYNSKISISLCSFPSCPRCSFTALCRAQSRLSLARSSSLRPQTTALLSLRRTLKERTVIHIGLEATHARQADLLSCSQSSVSPCVSILSPRKLHLE